jgi:two-component system sensor histidine kinase ChiS
MMNEQDDKGYFRYFPEEYLSLLGKKDMKDIKLGDYIQKELTVMFTDIKFFSSLMEKMSSLDVFRFLNSYFGRIVYTVKENYGVVNKYIGDAVMSVFAQSAEHALTAAIQMHNKLAIYNEERTFYKKQTIKIGTGIHFCKSILGIVGQNDHWETTIISDDLNLAYRLEKLTKIYDAEIIISQDVFDCLSDPRKYNYRMLDVVNVNNKNKYLPIFEIFDGLPSEKVKVKMSNKELYEEAFSLYQDHQIEKAKMKFETLYRADINDKAVGIFIHRCNNLLKFGM